MLLTSMSDRIVAIILNTREHFLFTILLICYHINCRLYVQLNYMNPPVIVLRAVIKTLPTLYNKQINRYDVTVEMTLDRDITPTKERILHLSWTKEIRYLGDRNSSRSCTTNDLH